MAVVWQISVLQLDDLSYISGVILHKAPYDYHQKIRKFKNLRKVISSYFIGVCANKPLIVSVDGEIYHTQTDKHGQFSISIAQRTVQNIPEVRFKDQTKPLSIIQNYPVLFPKTNGKFDVISDIDDTVVVSYTADFLKRIKTLAFIIPQKRKTINFTEQLYKEFEKQGARIFYISKSENNFFAMLSSFIKHSGLPQGMMILTPYLNIRQLLFLKKDFHFKKKNIFYIIKNSKHKKFILVGDDSQRDMEIYREIALEFPEKISGIYIRQTKNKVNFKKQNMLNQMKKLPLVFKYFKADSQINIADELETILN